MINMWSLRRGLLTIAGLNCLLGIPGAIPVWLVWYFFVNWPLAAIGWTVQDPSENDGALPWFIFGGPIVVGFTLCWWFANRSIRRRSPISSPWYWATSLLVTLVPTVVLIVVL